MRVETGYEAEDSAKTQEGAYWLSSPIRAEVVIDVRDKHEIECFGEMGHRDISLDSALYSLLGGDAKCWTFVI